MRRGVASALALMPLGLALAVFQRFGPSQKSACGSTDLGTALTAWSPQCLELGHDDVDHRRGRRVLALLMGSREAFFS